MPAACPQCHTYESLTCLIDGQIECEECGWVGEADDLDEVDSDDN